MCKPRPNQCSTEDYTPVLLDHARLDVFAEKYGIKDLDFINFIAHYVSTVHVKRAPVMLLGWSNTRMRTLHVVENWTGYVH